MARHASRRVETSALLRAPFAAMQWRLLLLWVVLLLIPTAVVSLPLWRTLSGLLDHSVHAPAWANGLNALMFGDVLSQLAEPSTALAGASFSGLLLTVLLLPLLNGMVVAAGRAGRTLTFGHLLQSGCIEYGRMFRVMLWSLLPYALAVGIAVGAFYLAQKPIDHAVLESRADLATYTAWVVAVLFFVLAQAWVEAMRGAFIADVGLRSATRALGRGFMQMLRRPLSTGLSFVLISAVGYALLLALGMGRIHTPALGLGGFLLALLLTELAVASVGWMHTARVFALAEVAASLRPPRRSAGRGQVL